MSTPDDQDFIVERGKVLPLPHNVLVAVRKLGGTLRYNDLTRHFEVHGLAQHGPLLDERAARHLCVAMEEKFGFRVGMRLLRLSLKAGAYLNRYTPQGGERA